MRILSLFLLFSLCIACKKENKNLPLQEVKTTPVITTKKERIVRYPDTTRYDSIKNKFSLTSRNFNVNRIDFNMPNHLDDFQVQFSNSPNDRLKIKYHKTENAFYINEEKVPYKTKDKNLIDLSILLDSVSISFSVNGRDLYKKKEISISKPYTVMTFSSKTQAMTNIVVSKNK